MAKFYSNGVRLPVFSVNSKNIRILRSPSDFYRNLLELTKTARSRISLSSLYIGNDMMSKEMVSKAVLNKRENPGLKLNVVLDFYRATRDFKNSSVQTLKPLINMKSVFSHIDICLFLNPKHNILSGYLPERVKEIFGVQHSKIYAFDDNVILSGANLSKEYFTKRLDRYFLIRSVSLSNYCHQFVKALQTLSFKIDPSFFDHKALKYSKLCLKLSSKSRRIEFCKKIADLNKAKFNKAMCDKDSLGSVKISPLIQFAPCGIFDEQKFILKLLNFAATKLPVKLKLVISSGYLNPPKEYINKLRKIEADTKIIFPSRKTNAFSKGKGLSLFIPSIYNAISNDLRTQLGNKVELLEYERNDKSFHSKGIWLFRPETGCVMTVLGSSNYNKRSVQRDMELSFLLDLSENNNDKLQTEIKKEIEQVKYFCSKFRRTNEKSKTAALILQIFGSFL